VRVVDLPFHNRATSAFKGDNRGSVRPSGFAVVVFESGYIAEQFVAPCRMFSGAKVADVG
jgi:hypothetical protein